MVAALTNLPNAQRWKTTLKMQISSTHFVMLFTLCNVFGETIYPSERHTNSKVNFLSVPLSDVLRSPYILANCACASRWVRPVSGATLLGEYERAANWSKSGLRLTSVGP